MKMMMTIIIGFAVQLPCLSELSAHPTYPSSVNLGQLLELMSQTGQTAPAAEFPLK